MGDRKSEMGVRVSTAGADFLADAPALKQLVLRRRSLAAKERKERKAGMSLLCGPCVLSRLEIGQQGTVGHRCLRGRGFGA